MHIGILEDDEAQQELYKLWLGTSTHTCECFSSAPRFMQAAKSGRFDLFLIDWILPESSGEEVLVWIRKNLGWDTPVIFVTSVENEANIVRALKTGADDYVIKPPKFMELLARIESLARRSRAQPVINLGHYQINMEQREILLDGKQVDLTQKEFELAAYMFSKPGKLLSRVHLLEKLWGLHAEIDTRTVDTHMSRIRRKLEIKPENGCNIIPVYGYGYRFEEADTSPKH